MKSDEIKSRMGIKENENYRVVPDSAKVQEDLRKYDYDAFISYSSKDKDWVSHLVTKLRKERVTLYFDEDSILPGDFFSKELESAIKKSRFFISILSESYSNSYGKKELNYRQRHIKDSNSIIPCLLETSDIPLDVSDLNCLDFSGEIVIFLLPVSKINFKNFWPK